MDEEELKKLKADLAKANTDLAVSKAQVKILEAVIAELKKETDDKAEEQFIKGINDFCDQIVKNHSKNSRFSGSFCFLRC